MAVLRQLVDLVRGSSQHDLLLLRGYLQGGAQLGNPAGGVFNGLLLELAGK